jgi:uncharacterized protein YegL
MAADVVFLYDMSANVSNEDLQPMFNTAHQLVNDFFKDQNQSQFSLVAFHSTPEKIFWLNTFSNIGDVHLHLDQTRLKHDRELGNMSAALRFVAQNCFKLENGGRSESRRFLITMTTGETDDLSKDFTMETSALRAENVTLVALGVGAHVRRDVLHDIASHPSYVFTIPISNVTTTFLPLRKELRYSICATRNQTQT